MSRRRRRKIWERPEHDDESEFDAPDRNQKRDSHTADLHGFGVDAALRRAAEELARCRAGGIRTLILVTGQGYGSHGGKARLRPELERWLKSPEAERLGATGVRVQGGRGALEVTVSRGD